MRTFVLLVGLVVLLVDDDQAEIGKGRNSAERAPTTTGASPAAIAAQLRARVPGSGRNAIPAAAPRNVARSDRETAR